MEGTVTHFLPLLAFSFLIAFVYASVGHGGASGYLAVISFLAIPHEQMATSALCLNLLVSGMAFLAFWKSAYFSWNLTWPFTLTSVPAAFLGGLIKISPSSYSFLLGGVLLFAGYRLLIDTQSDKERTHSTPPLLISLLVGAMIGILSGIVGVGGGIFLSPLLLLLHWATPKQTASTSAFFIFVNSLAGLFGRVLRQGFVVNPSPMMILVVIVAFFGGMFGSRLGANHFSGQWVRRVLAFVLFGASFKLFRS